MITMNKKAQAFEQLGKLAIGVVIVAIVLTVAFMVMSQGKSQIAATEGTTIQNCSSAGCNATDSMVEATGTIPDWIPIIIIVGIGVIMLGMVKLLMKK